MEGEQLRGQQVEGERIPSQIQILKPQIDYSQLERLTPEEFRSILDSAMILQQRDEEAAHRNAKISELERAVKLGDEDERGIQVAAMYRVATDLGLQKEYITDVLSKVHPSIEQQKIDLQRTHAIPSHSIIYNEINNSVRDYFDKKAQQLGKFFTDSEIKVSIGAPDWTPDYCDGFLAYSVMIEKRKITRKLSRGILPPWNIKMRKKRGRKETILAGTVNIRYNRADSTESKYSGNINLHSPVYLSICGDFSDFSIPRQNTLNKQSGITLEHQYNPEK